MRQLVFMPDPADGGDEAACDETARLRHAPCKTRARVVVPEQYGQSGPRGCGQLLHDRLIGGAQGGHTAVQRTGAPAGAGCGDFEAAVPDGGGVRRQQCVWQAAAARLAGDEEAVAVCLDAPVRVAVTAAPDARRA